MTRESGGERPTGQPGDALPNVRWDDSNMRSLYANVVNVTGTREELILLFGIHQAWQSGAKEVAVQLLDRVILNPHAAKRLHLLLGRALREYETRYGVLPVEGSAPSGPGESLPSS